MSSLPVLIESGGIVLPPVEQFGFCEGVVSADDLLREVTLTARMHGINAVHCYHDIVHNAEVRAGHEENGVIFVDDVMQIPSNSVVVTSAHGVSPEVTDGLRQKGCEHFDAVCPLVTHTHKAIQTARREGEKVIYVCHGKPGESKKVHDEVAGALGHMDFYFDKKGNLVRDPIERAFVEIGEDLTEIRGLINESANYRLVTQTTLNDQESIAFREQIATYIRTMQSGATISRVELRDVCPAVRHRQDGVRLLLNIVPPPDRIVIVTDPTSSNGKSYVDIAEALAGPETEVIQAATAAEIVEIPKEGRTAVSASASTPDQTIRRLAEGLGASPADLIWKREGFRLPYKSEEIQRRIGELATKLGIAS